jgi:6-pyruvoyltetrahydropterin/6-carboxytetrahydropterin synthase
LLLQSAEFKAGTEGLKISNQLTTIEISKEYLHFAAAHFTIFSATDRENLHGHNFQVTLNIEALVGDDGLTFDYNILKTSVKALCDSLDEQVLMPTQSPHLTIEQDNEYTYAIFNGERIPFLARDLTLMPLRNITVEELSAYLLNKIREDPSIATLDIRAMVLKCSSGEGQWAVARWPAEQAA